MDNQFIKTNLNIIEDKLNELDDYYDQFERIMLDNLIVDGKLLNFEDFDYLKSENKEILSSVDEIIRLL